MSVDMNFLTVFGVNVGPNEESFMEDYDAAENKLGAAVPEVTYDCMCGEYLILGPVVFRYRADGDSEMPTDFEGITVQELIRLEAEYRVQFRIHFKKYAHLIDKVPFRLISFVHYT